MYLNLSSEKVLNNFLEISNYALPRILTQICRDPNSTSYGCADRNWWHYKIRDFPSIILQQSAAILWSSSKCGILTDQNRMQDLIKASCLFWNTRAIRFRSFEEYYPWEEGYPPLAFSTLSMARLVGEGAIDFHSVEDGINIATKQLLSRFESNAANQQVAGLAALSWIRRISPKLVSDEAWEFLLLKTLSLQDPEGWYQEYGGPDLGYLSVTIDCIWDAYDACKDKRLLDSAIRAFEFIEKMTNNTEGRSIGMHNARNTDYIVPYGITRFALAKDMGDIHIRALKLLQNIFLRCNQNSHFLSAVDDRYWCHYIGLSVMRSIQCLSESKPIVADVKAFKDTTRINYLSSSGYITFNANDKRAFRLVSTKKGGCLTVFQKKGCLSDFGWIILAKKGQFITSWWSNDWNVDNKGSKSWETHCVISGCFFKHNELESSPFRHLALRVSSFLLGRSLISILKAKLIFNKNKTNIKFKREIFVEKNILKVVDSIDNMPDSYKLVRAPRSSKRHVASADNFHMEDLLMQKKSVYCIEEHKSKMRNSITIRTSYRIND